MNRSICCTKSIERDLQEKMYGNISLLNMMYPPSEDFKSVFKKDMFSKHNKAAFLHVMHYLLSVLNPEMVSQKLSSWPTCNVISRENKFRNEVLQCLNEINSTYEDANLPTMLSSHLLAPGGYRFINLMYLLSQLVLKEKMRKIYPVELLEQPRPSKNDIVNQSAYENFVRLTANINRETVNAMGKFERRFEYFKKEAENIVSDQNSVHKQLKEVQDNIEIEESKFKRLEISDEELRKMFEDIEDKSEIVNNIVKTYNECVAFVNHLKEYKSDSGAASDLSELLKFIIISMKRQLSELPVLTVPELEKYLELAQTKKEELEKIKNHLQIQQEEFILAMNTSKHMLKKLLVDLGD